MTGHARYNYKAKAPRGNHHHQATSQATPPSGSTSSAAGQSAIAHAARRTDRKMYNDQKRGGGESKVQREQHMVRVPTYVSSVRLTSSRSQASTPLRSMWLLAASLLSAGDELTPFPLAPSVTSASLPLPLPVLPYLRSRPRRSASL